MAGIEAGKTWSRIGAETAPTDSAAAGVWGDLNEVAENVGAGTWPAPKYSQYEYIAGHTFDGSTSSYTFSGIPQTYNRLRRISCDLGQSSSIATPRLQLYGDTGS